MTLIWTVLFLSLSTFAQEKVTGTLYGIKSKPETVLYTSVFEANMQGDVLSTTATYKDPQGQVAVVEKGQLKGAQILSYEMDRPQTQEKGQFKVTDGKIFFTYEGPGGKKKSAEEKVKGDLLSTANFNAFVVSRWDELAGGKGLDVRFAVWDRLETVGFTLQKTGETEKNGEKLMELRMKPTSFVIAALVGPIFFWYSQTDKKLKTMKGRVAPKIQDGGKWKDLDAMVIYAH